MLRRELQEEEEEINQQQQQQQRSKSRSSSQLQQVAGDQLPDLPQSSRPHTGL